MHDPREEEGGRHNVMGRSPILKETGREEEAGLPYERPREEDEGGRSVPRADLTTGAVFLAAAKGGGESRRRNQALGGG
jgi:hypothetical protein